MLAQDSFETHLTDDVKKSLTKSKIESMIVLGGCTKYIQVLDVLWNKPFKGYSTQHLAFYDEWPSNGKQEYMDAGNMKPVPRGLTVKWVIKSWQDISSEIMA